MNAGHFRTLFAYNRWANERILAASAKAEASDYGATATGLSFGSLHATLVHILVAEIVWVARFEGGLPPEALKDARSADRIAAEEIRSFGQVASMWEAEWRRQAAFVEALRDEDVERPLKYRTQYDEPNEQPLHELMAHVVNHGTQFRAEAAVRLTQLGLSPGDLDMIIYLRERG